jgi:tetratricopeptide (TPR) repeat protein
VAELARAFRDGDGSLAERLVAGLEAAQAAGGDIRGQQSAAIYVERPGAGLETGELVERIVDLRVDDHEQPIVELRRLLEIQLRWDYLRRASGHRRAGRLDAAVDVLAAGLERYPDDAILLYDLACYESLAGRLDAALAHVRRSLELDASLKPLAEGDPDLEALRERGDRF